MNDLKSVDTLFTNSKGGTHTESSPRMIFFAQYCQTFAQQFHQNVMNGVFVRGNIQWSTAYLKLKSIILISSPIQPSHLPWMDYVEFHWVFAWLSVRWLADSRRPLLHTLSMQNVDQFSEKENIMLWIMMIIKFLTESIARKICPKPPEPIISVMWKRLRNRKLVSKKGTIRFPSRAVNARLWYPLLPATGLLNGFGFLVVDFGCCIADGTLLTWRLWSVELCIEFDE